MIREEKINYKKIAYSLLYLLLIVIVLNVFTMMYNVIKVKDASVTDINRNLKKTPYISRMTKGDSRTLRRQYGINKDEAEKFLLYAPKSNMDADEILVLKTKSQDDLKVIKEKVQSRIDKQEKSFMQYRPKEYEIIKKCVLKEEGEYLILIISKDSSKIEKTVDDCFA